MPQFALQTAIRFNWYGVWFDSVLHNALIGIAYALIGIKYALIGIA
jgi:hypothetical protein